MSFAGVKDCVGRYRGRKPPGRSRAAAFAQRIVACDNPYWVLPDAEPRRIAASLPSPAERKILKLSGKQKGFVTMTGCLKETAPVFFYPKTEGGFL